MIKSAAAFALDLPTSEERKRNWRLRLETSIVSYYYVGLSSLIKQITHHINDMKIREPSKS